MSLVSLAPITEAARKANYAVGAFNPVDYASMKAIIRAACADFRQDGSLSRL